MGKSITSSSLAKRSAEPTASNVPANYFGFLSVRIGIVSGILGALLIMAVIAILAAGAGEDITLSPRVIASVVFGDSAATGLLPVFVGTIIHLLSGAIYGAVFAMLIPRLPRPFWIVAGLLYGVAIWVIAVIALPLMVQPVGVNEVTYFNILLISHLLFGLNLGIAGGLFGLLGSGQRSS